MARPAIYRPRRPEASALSQCLEQHWEESHQAYAPLYEKGDGPLRPVVETTVGRFLECGILRHGFARIRCGSCHEECWLAFSCKPRFFCPSCQAKRVAAFVERLTEEVLEAVDHRQLVWTLRKKRPLRHASHGVPLCLKKSLFRRLPVTVGWPARASLGASMLGQEAKSSPD